MFLAKSLNKTIQGKAILKDVNLQVKPGQVVCVIGPSGGGKSTLLSCLALLQRPDSGTISVDEKDFIFKTGREDYKQFPYPKVTIVFQGLFLWPHLTNKQNIFLPLADAGAKKINFQKWVSKFKVEHILDKYPHECSGGEKQRIAIIRQLMLEPQYLLLDEVTSALDLEQVSVIVDIINELKSKGVGIILVTHMINFAKAVSDYFYFIENGKIVEEDNIRALKAPTSERVNHFLNIYS